MGLIVVSIPLIMFGCGKKEKVDVEEVPQVNQEEVEVLDDLYEDTFNESTESTDVVEDIKVEKDDKSDALEELNEEAEKFEEEKKEQASKNEKSATGQFQGFADGNFIEMKIGNSYSVFKVSGDVKSKLNSKKVGDTISFTYVASAGQQLITAIK